MHLLFSNNPATTEIYTLSLHDALPISTTTADNGVTFAVVASNAAGNATSTSATLTVNSAPAPAIQLSSTSISFANDVVNAPASQALVITNSGTATLTISQISATGAPFSV